MAGDAFDQVMSAVMDAVDRAKSNVNQIESEFPFLADLGEYSLEQEGIDIGDNGTVTPWENTPWTDGFDWSQKTTVTVSGIQLPDETITIEAEPDSLDRGTGWLYTILGGPSERFGGVVITSVEGQFGLREKLADYVENNYSHLKNEDGGGEPEPTPPSTEVVERLEYGWVIVLKKPGSQVSVPERHLVAGSQGGSTVYLNEQGEVIKDQHRFPSKKKARAAFRRWRDRREKKISDSRRELNEKLRERAEQFETLEENQEQQTNVVTESNVVEGETTVTEGDSQIVSTRSSANTGRSGTGSGAITLPEEEKIPVEGIGVVLLGVIYLVLRDTGGET